MIRLGLAALFVVASSSAPARAQSGAIEIRPCPSSSLWAYPLESRQAIHSVVLQQAVLVNRTAAAVEITGIDLELLRAGRVIESRRLGRAELVSWGRIAAVPARPAGGALAACNVEGRTITPASRASLHPGEALLVARQLLAFQGERDALRVRVHARSGERTLEATREIRVRVELSATAFRFPLRGAWWVGAGATPYTHHRWSASEEFALDVGKLGAGGLDHRGTGERFRDYFAYGAAVLAAADGTVVAAVDGIAEDARAMRRPGEAMDAYARRIRQIQAANVQRGLTGLAGNHVVVDHGRGEYSFYAHLQPRSVKVRPGARVRQGQPIGRLGSSGNSTGPHLHFQVCDGPDPLDCASIPPRFQGIDLPWGDFPRPVQSGDLVVAP
jgi:murein DD-endopeptidase MepM/ murein hydrolase activator NlpD